MSVLPVVVSFLVTVALFWIVAYVIFHFTEILKVLSRVTAKLPAMKWIAISGYGSYLAAFVLALLAVFYPGSGISDSLASLFKAVNIPVDSNVVQLLAAFLLSLIASAQKDSGKMPSPLNGPRG